MKAYRYNEDTKKFEGECDCQIDPLESQIQKKTVYITPGSATLVPCKLIEKEGYEIVWNGADWEYKEIPKDPEPEPYVPTPLEKARQEYYEYKQKLTESDYIDAKIEDARNWGTQEEVEELKEKYRSVYEDRKVWRQKVNDLEELIAELEKQEENKDGE